MQMFSKTLLYVILSYLLLSGVSGIQRPCHRARGDNHFGHARLRVTARLRRCRQDNSAPHPVRPCKNALLPPDEDDDDGDRDRLTDTTECLASAVHDQLNRSLFPTIHSQPLPTNVPRYQSLCILLI